MQLQIDHQTLYEYAVPVHLEPHTFRLRPRADGIQWLLSYEMRISPQPRLMTQSLDAAGNAVVRAWFSDASNHLRVDVSTQVKLTRDNPFDFFLEDGWATLPMKYPPALAQMLEPYMHTAENTPEDNEADRYVRQHAQEIAQSVKHRTLDFLLESCRWLEDRTQVEHRQTGDPYQPHHTLTTGRGACRDVAVLHMEMCRMMGLAARFVSGYEQGDPTQRQDLHAWTEVYLPGAGWRAFDPTRGVAVGTRHVALAAAAHPVAASPITGSYRGPAMTPRLTTMVRAVQQTQPLPADPDVRAVQQQQQQQQ